MHLTADIKKLFKEFILAQEVGGVSSTYKGTLPYHKHSTSRFSLGRKGMKNCHLKSN